MSKEKRPTVFITQVPHRHDKETGAFVPAHNISPADEHGEVKVMMPSRASFFATADLVSQLREHLVNYDYKAGDSIVFLGDPSIVAVAAALLGRIHGSFIVLKWDRNVGRYLPTHVHV